MRHFGIAVIMTILLVGMLGTANSYAEGNTAVSQSAPTATPGGLFGSNTTAQTTGTADGDTVFDFASVPDPEIVDIYNGEVANGVLTLNAPTEEDWAEVGFYIPAQDYAIEMDVTYTQYGSESTWLYFLMRIQDDFCNAEVIYDPVFGATSGSVRLLSDCEDFRSLGDGTGPTMALNTPHTIRVEAQGSTYSLFIDGQPVGSWQDDTLSGGYVGIIGTVGPAQVIVDNITIRDLTLPDNQANTRPNNNSGNSTGQRPPSAESSDTVFDFASVPDPEIVDIYNGEVANGVLTLNAPTEEDWAEVGFYIPAQDYAIEMDVTYTQYGTDYTWLYFLMRIQDDFCNTEMIYDPVSGETSGSVRLLSDCEDFRSLGDGTGPTMALNTPHTIRVEAQGSTYSLFINDQVVGTWQDDTLSAGYVGIIGTLGPAQVIVDNITIRDLSQDTGRPTENQPSGQRRPTPRSTPSGDLFGG